VTTPDFDVYTPPTRPAGTATASKYEGYQCFALNNEAVGSHATDILVETNNTDGTAFEYYQP